MEQHNKPNVHKVIMRFQLFFMSALFFAAPIIYSQEKVVILNTGKQDVRIDLAKPTIYLSFERFDSEKFIWLRLHNNSRWTISFRTEDDFYGLAVDSSTWSAGRDAFGLIDGAKVKPKYAVESLPEQKKIDNLGCVSSTSWLSSGRSIVFRIPRDGFESFNKLRITFIYEWETEGYEPIHQVTFEGWELPKAEY